MSEQAVEAATEAMSLPGEKGIVRQLTRDDAERGLAAALPAIRADVIAEVVSAIRDHVAYHHKEPEADRESWLNIAAFIECEFGGPNA